MEYKENKGLLSMSFCPFDSENNNEVRISKTLVNLNKTDLDELREMFYDFTNALGYKVYGVNQCKSDPMPEDANAIFEEMIAGREEK